MHEDKKVEESPKSLDDLIQELLMSMLKKARPAQLDTDPIPATPTCGCFHSEIEAVETLIVNAAVVKSKTYGEAKAVLYSMRDKVEEILSPMETKHKANTLTREEYREGFAKVLRFLADTLSG